MVQVNEDKAHTFLKESIKGILHSGREFYEHLMGTEEMLRRWGLSQEVYMAGSFHSIYGTEVLEISKKFTRTTIKKFIGAESEHLVHLFCTLRPRGKSIISKETKISDKDRFNLACLEYANLIEQVEKEDFTEKHIKHFEKLSEIIKKYNPKIFRNIQLWEQKNKIESYQSLKFLSNKKLRLLPDLFNASEKKIIDDVSNKKIVASTYTGKKVASYCVLELKVDENDKLIFIKQKKIQKPMEEEQNLKVINTYKKVLKRAMSNIIEMEKNKVQRNQPFFVEIYIPQIEIKPSQKNYSSVQWHKDRGFWINKTTDYTLIYEITENIAPNNWIGGELYFRCSVGEKNLNPIAKINGIYNQAALIDNRFGEHILSNMVKEHKNSVIRNSLIFHFFLPSSVPFTFR